MKSRTARVGLVTGLVLSGTAGAVVATAAPAAAQGPCGYVTTDDAQVRENPSINSVVRKTKPKGSYVTGPCVTGLGSDGRYWTAVDCDCATNGIGWIISNKLTQ